MRGWIPMRPFDGGSGASHGRSTTGASPREHRLPAVSAPLWRVPSGVLLSRGSD